MSEEEKAPESGGVDAGESSGGGERQIAYSKYQGVVKGKRSLERERDELRAEVNSLTERLATTDTLAETLEAEKAAHAATRAEFGQYKLVSSKLNTTQPDAIDAALWQYGRIGGDEKPALDAWLDGMAADPSTAPSILAPFFAGKAPDAAGDKPAPRKAPPSRTTPDDAGAGLTTDVLRKMRLEKTSKGDFEDWRRARKALGIARD